MARGWESKSVESQIEDRQNRQESGPPRPAAEREKAAKKESLEMSRRRITRELEGSRSAAHRAALENALQHLDEELRKLA